MACDLAYAVLIERVTADVRLRQQHALMIAALGGEADVPDLQAELDEFDAALASAAVPIDPDDVERDELLSSLGLPGRTRG